MLLGACAGGLGWGIRGQYGHETGAMIAGLLVSLVVALLFGGSLDSRQLIRAVAWGTIAMGFGGSMTYAQTIGLTQNAPVIGNVAALRWGMIGLALKGGIWIAFGALFLGMGLSGVRYRTREMLVLMLTLVGLYFVGCATINAPFDPANKILPRVYFSASWEWEPGASLKPRPECWGGLLLSLVAVFAFTFAWKRDAFAWRLGLFGLLGGAMGFPLGQSLQSFHAWNPQLFSQGAIHALDAHINWWNMMETTFGAVMGAAIVFGVWKHRVLIGGGGTSATGSEPSPCWFEGLLLAAHTALLIESEFGSVRWIHATYDIGLVLGLLPMVASASGRWWPWFLALPVTLLPIAVKTVNQLAREERAVEPELGWVVYCALPMAFAVALAIRLARSAMRSGDGNHAGLRWPAYALLASTWIYFGLNFAFFRYPWPWSPWTYRTPNGIIYAACATLLTIACVKRLRAARGEP